MRVLIDTNVFISHLLSSESKGVVQEIFHAWEEQKFTLLLPEALMEEIFVTMTGKPHLAKRISISELKEFLDLLKALGEEIPRIDSPIPTVTRDPKDDYLLAYALVGEADYLVSGDKDLLVLQGEIPELEILTPYQFSQLL